MKKCELKKNKTVYTCIPYSYDIFNEIDIIESRVPCRVVCKDTYACVLNYNWNFILHSVS